MRCITYHSLPSPLLPERKYIRQIRTVWLANKPAGIPENWTGITSASSVKTRAAAIASPLFMATSSPPTNGNLSVLLLTSGVLLFTYWVANFVVPGIIIKDFQTEDSNENGDNQSDD